jgi:site-specific recombinase XerD
MATIKLKFRASTTDSKDGVLYYQLIHHRIVRQISTKYRIPEQIWDKQRQIVLDAEIRHKTQYDIGRIYNIVKEIEQVNPYYTADDIVKEFADKKRSYTLFNYMTKMVIKRKLLYKTRTAEGYQCALNSFKRFRQGTDILLDEVTGILIEEYQAWLVNNGIAQNTISFYMRKLRATYNNAVEEGIIIDKRPFKHVFTGTAKTKKRALLSSEITKIKRCSFTYNHNIEYARDMFILSFYLRGMSFIDMAYLKKSDLRNGILTYRRAKTNQQIAIKWTNEMQNIIDKYPYNQSAYLLPIITGNCSDERKTYINVGRKINYHLKKLGKLLNIRLTLTMYCSRHSWATVARDNGVALNIISEGLGHDNERTTRIYLASLDSSTIDKANDLIIHSV